MTILYSDDLAEKLDESIKERVEIQIGERECEGKQF